MSRRLPPATAAAAAAATATSTCKLAHDARGSSTIDFAFALPVLVTLMIATLQMGQVLHAKGSLSHAVGEGARLAKVDPTATQSEVLDRVKAALPSLNEKRLSDLRFTRSVRDGARMATVSVSYTTEANYPVISFPVTLSESKTVYLPN